MKQNYKPSSWIECIVKKTYLSTSGFCFEVYNHNLVGNLESFVEFYIEQRKQMWIDHDYDNGVWSEAVDHGYQNLLKVIDAGDYKMGYYENTFENRLPAEKLCCGEWLPLPNFTNTCSHCGADYNSSGQLLAPRHFWGEETGEHWWEIY